ncbi:MAG: serine hydrolase [Candidatus Heimdallarchaeota archaeon]|nr:serine hydrolase [Candidatus Heimdallarchaeota archaeon]
MKTKGICWFILILLFVVSSSFQNNYLDSSRDLYFTSREDFPPQDSRMVYPENDPTDPDTIQSFMDDLLERQLTDYHIPGAAVAVVNSTDIIYANGYGFSDIEEMRFVNETTTMFRAASVSKLFVWTAVMQLVEQGKLVLDEDINNYLTTFKIPDTFSEPITMEHLMSHSAGFEQKILVSAPRTVEDLIPLEEYLETKMPARITPPGEVSAYSNYGTALAGYIVAQITNTTFEDYIKTNIFGPLNMAYSTFHQPVPQNLEENLVTGYYYDGERYLPHPFEYVYETPAGALSISANDIAKFMMAHLNNGTYKGAQILEKTTTQLMHTQHYTMDPRITGFAHGFMELSINGLRIIWHGGDLSCTHTACVLIPEKNLGFYVSYNTGSTARYYLFEAFFDYFYPAPDPEPIEPPADFKQRARKFTGYYHSMRNDFSSLMAAPNLIFTTNKIQATKDGALEIFGVRFIEIDHLLFRSEEGDARIAFREDSKGRITYLFIDNDPTNSHEKMTGFRSIEVILTILVVISVGYLAIPITEITYFVNRKIKKTEKAEEPILARIAKWTSIGLTIAALVFIIGTTVVLLFAEIWYEIPPILIVLLVIPILMIIATAALVVSQFFMWKEKYWDLPKRIVYTFSTITSIFFIVFLGCWNFIGFNF